MDRKLTVQPTMVTFSAPLTEHQTVDLDIKNDWNKTIIFKMKTTRPDAFKMKPVYGLVEAGEKKKVILTLKKWDPNKKPKKNDHFTVVMAPAPDKCNNPIKTWKSWKESKRSEASIGACRRQVKITYKGIALKEIKKKSPKDELAKAPIVKAEEIEEKKEEKIEAVKEERKADEDEKRSKWKLKKKEEEEEEEQEEKLKKKVDKGKKEEDDEEEEEEEEEDDEKPKKKPKKEKAEDEKSKKKEEEEEDGKGKEEDEADEEDEEE